MTASPRVVVIALDGADKDLLFEWAESGELPNLRALVERSAWCRVDNPPGLFSGSLWPSFYTGVSPARHGRYCSSQLELGTYRFRPMPHFDPRLDPFWNVLGACGRRVAVIDAPKARLEEGLNGVQVNDWATEGNDASVEVGVSPRGALGDVLRELERPRGLESALGSRDERGFASLRDHLVKSVRGKAELSRAVLDQEPWDVFLTVFAETHVAGHLCWHLHDPEHPRYDEGIANRVGDVVKEVYRETDRALAGLLDRCGAETRVLVYANNGMGGNYSGNFLLDRVLLERDRMRLGAGRRAVSYGADWLERWTPGAIYDGVYPFHRGLRRALGLTVRDPEHRTCFHTRSNEIAGGVRINLEGREPNGLVSEASYDAFCRELRDALSELFDPSSGRRVVRRVIVTREMYRGDHLESLPDLLVEWDQAAPLSALALPGTKSVRGQYGGVRTGDHRPDGLLVASGPDFARGRVAPVSILDLAPTLTGLVDVAFPQAEGDDVRPQLSAS